MNDCEALRTVDISSLTGAECSFLLDVLVALLDGPTTLTAAARKTARSSYHEVEQRLRLLEARGLVQHRSPIRSGHLVPEFSLTNQGRTVVGLADRAPPSL